MAEMQSVTYYEVQRHYAGTTCWMGGWTDRSLDRSSAEASADEERQRVDATVIDEVRVTEVTIETVGPLPPVVVQAPDVYILTTAEMGVERGMAAQGFACVDHRVEMAVRVAEDDSRCFVTLTFAKAKE